MSLAAGTRLGSSEILAAIGAGGMDQYVAANNAGAAFDVMPDGRFLMIKGSDPQGVREIVVVQNWLEEVKRLAPVR